MKLQITFLVFAFCTALGMPVIISCQEQGKKKAKEDKIENNDPMIPVAAPIGKVSSDCDPSLWKNVYNPDRLQVLDKCKTVTGVIEESNAEEDGDQHMLLKLDPQFENLINKRNKKKKNGDLVIEAVCINKIKDKKVGDACKGYINNVQLPKVGDRVSVTGSYVLDVHNGWNEIHPITKIENVRVK